MTYIFVHKFEDAFKSYEKSFEKNPLNAAALYNMANCQWIQGDYSEAFDKFEEALNIDSSNLDWRNYLSNLYIEKKNYSFAKKHIFICQSIDSNYISNYVTQAKLLISQGKNEEALKLLNVNFFFIFFRLHLKQIVATRNLEKYLQKLCKLKKNDFFYIIMYFT